MEIYSTSLQVLGVILHTLYNYNELFGLLQRNDLHTDYGITYELITEKNFT